MIFKAEFPQSCEVIEIVRVSIIADTPDEALTKLHSSDFSTRLVVSRTAVSEIETDWERLKWLKE
jgi:hypothetical protein